MLQKKTALVTGSTSGIGLGIAKTLAMQGANVILNGFGDASTIIDEVRTCSPHPIEVLYHPADMSQPEQIASLFAFAHEKLGGVDILVNNAGIQHVAPIETFPIEAWNNILAINLSSAFHTTRLAIPYMRQKNWGRIVNIASVHGLVASTGKAAYVAAKHGVIGLTKVIALEAATTGVTCNAVCPGWVLTPLVQKQVDAIATQDHLSTEGATKRLLNVKQPSEQFVTPEQIGELVNFLCSEAASNVRGAAWNIDGGWVAQ